MADKEHFFSMENKTAIVTGGTSGIGHAVAKRYIDAGAQVVIVGRRADGDEIATKIGAHFLRADVSDEAQISEALANAEDEIGKLDVIVSNAGMVNPGKTLEQQEVDEIDAVFAVNVKGVYNGLHYGPRHMNDGGSIINMSSVGALISAPAFGQYSSTKAAVNSLTRTSALELAPRRIRVNAICPGTIRTPMVSDDNPSYAIAEKLSPLGRVGTTDDVAGICHFLASEDSSFITGQIIAVDGGLTAGLSYGILNAIVD